MKILLSVVLMFFFLSCSLKKYRELTQEEQTFIKSQTFYNDCKITVEKDHNVIDNDSFNGHLYIIIDFSNSKTPLCSLDSAKITQKIVPFVTGFEKIMDKRKFYDSIHVEASIMNRKTKGMEYLSCGKFFNFSLNNLKKFKYREVRETRE
jgi:hypothetical protein